MQNEFILSLLTVAFGCWAGVIWYFASGIRQDLRTIGIDLKEESAKLNKYIVQTESRLAVLESIAMSARGN